MLGAIAITTDPANLIWVSGVVGFFLPHLIAIISQQHWRPGFKSVIAFGICLLTAVVICWTKGQFDFHNWAASAGVVFIAARTSYAALWKPTGINDNLEASTTLARSAPPASSQ